MSYPNYGENAAMTRKSPDKDFYDVGPRGARLNTEPLSVGTGANSRQVDGDHYGGGEVQHWDLVNMMGMDYYIGNATKYLCRAHKKNGAKDYAKAEHYIQKRCEIGWDTYAMNVVDVERLLWDFCIAQDMPLLAAAAMFALLTGKVDEARRIIQNLSASE